MLRAATASGLTAAAVAVVAFVWAWCASGPWLGLGLNWDTASYVALYASGQGSWRQVPWNSHFGLGPVYQLGATWAGLFGGSFIDGVRLVGAFAFAVAGAAVAVTARRFCGTLGVAWAMLYVFSWAPAHLLLTVEDNVLYLPFAVGALALSSWRLGRWRLQDSLVAGALGAGGILMSWQAGLYLFPPVYVALVQGGPARTWTIRLRDVGALLLAAFIGLNLFVLSFRLLSAETPLASLWRTLFSRPEPSFFPRDLSAFVGMLQSPRVPFAQVGLGVLGALAPGLGRVAWLQPGLPAVGVAVLVLVCGGAVWAIFEGRRAGWKEAQMTMVVWVALLVATGLYVDLPVDKHKRYDFIPLMLCLLGAALTGNQRPRKRLWGGLLAALVLVEVVGIVTWAQKQQAGLGVVAPAGYHGQAGKPWFAHVRELRRAHPDACLFTFAFTPALAHGRYQLEIPAALWSELPDHLLVAPPEAVAAWPRKVKTVAPGALPPQRACEWRDPALR